uniref:Polymer-forming cytoskeletal protein n=1 Tax=Chaetoceros debilis TaxID=122233 RepID=A0A7S3V973_9STRA
MEKTADDFSVVIGKNSMLNLEGDGHLTFSDSLLVEGTLVGNLKCLVDVNAHVDTDFHGDYAHRSIIEANDEDEPGTSSSSPSSSTPLTPTLVKIGTEGELHADVKCVSTVEVWGKLVGDAHCDTLMVAPGAVIIGDISARIVSIGMGASLVGSMQTGEFSPPFSYSGRSSSSSSSRSESGSSDRSVMSDEIMDPLEEDEIGSLEEDVLQLTKERRRRQEENINNSNIWEDSIRYPIKKKTKDNIWNENDENSDDESDGVNNNAPDEFIASVGNDNSDGDGTTPVANRGSGPASISIYHKIMQDAALKKGCASYFGKRFAPRNVPLPNDSASSSSSSSSPQNKPWNWGDASRDSTDDILDDFGNSIGQYKDKDSFGNPLIRGADQDQVDSFRSIRDLSKETRKLLDNHRKEKEREDILRKSSPRGSGSGNSSSTSTRNNDYSGSSNSTPPPEFLNAIIDNDESPAATSTLFGKGNGNGKSRKRSTGNDTFESRNDDDGPLPPFLR